jgi:hypothetical protein
MVEHACEYVVKSAGELLSAIKRQTEAVLGIIYE